MRNILCLAAGLLFAQVAYSAEQSVVIGNEKLSVGMSEKQAFGKLETYLRFDCQEGIVKSCILMNKDGPPYSFKANIVFKNGKITSVRKYWGEGFEGTDPSQFVRTFYNLVSNLAKEGPVTVTLSTSENREPGITSEAIFIRKGTKTISITVTEGLKSEGKRISTFTNLDEAIE
jgi:hypothetical protein